MSNGCYVSRVELVTYFRVGSNCSCSASEAVSIRQTIAATLETRQTVKCRMGATLLSRQRTCDVQTTNIQILQLRHVLANQFHSVERQFLAPTDIELGQWKLIEGHGQT